MNPPGNSKAPASAANAGVPVRRRNWKMFWIGLGVRLLGLALIWLGDGSSHPLRKALVILGVVLSIGGITVLRYLLISGFRKK